ncbi:hypothetical protein ACFMBG_17570 [Leisingera sp. D0M16]|uniref:hypothetical protein n=1 Tax=Leisingera coralii TaxID=3351347 RepID=UPI003B766BC8
MRQNRQDPAKPWILIAIIAVQPLCAAVFLGGMIADPAGLRPVMRRPEKGRTPISRGWRRPS